MQIQSYSLQKVLTPHHLGTLYPYLGGAALLEAALSSQQQGPVGAGRYSSDTRHCSMPAASLSFHLGFLLSHLKAFSSEDKPAPPTHSLLTLASTSDQADILLQWEREKINITFQDTNLIFQTSLLLLSDFQTNITLPVGVSIKC